ncbi:K02A2.6-like [Cordylochernes scorpioides]|uniref:K02A2.6-like n=1 Tax=Cordylochernes scorpioides TaxID=51811 RepID=A0ABY6K9T8_9ARAC|nr:K02A2.6-like [Cordylochernes scorpioides]
MMQQSIEELFIIPNNYDPLLGRIWIRHLKINLEEIDQENLNQIKELKVSSINDDYDIEKEFPEIYTQKVGCVPDFLITFQLRQGEKPSFTPERNVPYALGRRWKRNWTHWKQTVEHPIAFASRSLTDAEQNYSQLDREALAIVFGVDHFFYYPFGHKFTLITDNQPLTRIFHSKSKFPKMTSARLLRYASFQAGFDYIVSFKKGTENQIAYCSSRAPTAQGYVTTGMIINEEDPPSTNWERIHIDYAGPFQGYYYLVLIDAKSRWAEIKAISEPPTSLNTIKLLNDIFSTHGYPFVMVSDNASIFTGDTFSNYCLENGIRQKFIAPRHPTTNGLAERNVQTFKNKLKSMINENVPIHQKIQKILLRY